jgi:hypothetical protein
MALRRTLVLAAIFSIAPTAMVMAQTEPQNDQTAPSSASSPHQRDATSTPAPEASSTDQTNGTSPAAASSPHQQQSTHVASKQSMKDCIAKQQQENSGMSKADAKKACKAEMKGPG